MQAGCYGRAFCPVGSYPRKRILQICQSLRILNALRGPNVGLPLTLAQLDALGAPVLISRLVNARRHLLALRIAEMLNLDTDKVTRTHVAVMLIMRAFPGHFCAWTCRDSTA